MTTPVVIDTIRTPIGRAYKGSLVDVRPDDMAAFAIRALVDRHPSLPLEAIGDVIAGCALGQGEAGWNIARNAALLAGLPDGVPGTTVNRWCASSLQAIAMASHAIRAGEGECFIVVGVESTSRCGEPLTQVTDANPRFLDPQRPDFAGHAYMSMGETAERVADLNGIPRERMDAYAKLSQDRAVAAIDSGFFEREINPLPLGDGRSIAVDDCPRRGVSLEALAALQPVFRDGGRVTAGNSCPLNDGAAAALITSERFANEHGLRPRARIVGTAVSGIAPEIMGLGPVEACRSLLRASQLTIGDIDVVELNEAFAAQVLAVSDVLGIGIEDQLNPHGGAIALGHPFGMTGVRLLGTLLNDLETGNFSRGIATLCVGGGQGMAALVERL